MASYPHVAHDVCNVLSARHGTRNVAIQKVTTRNDSHVCCVAGCYGVAQSSQVGIFVYGAMHIIFVFLILIVAHSFAPKHN